MAKGTTNTSINFKKVDEAIVDHFIEKLGIKPKKNDLRSKVQALQIQQRETTNPKDLSEPCTVCGGQSNVELESCPFCGTTDDPEAVAKAEAAQAKAAPIEAVEVVEAEGHVVITGKGGVKDLESAEKIINDARNAHVDSYYDLGIGLRFIHDHNLWKHRTGPDGKPIYKSFAQYCQVEQDMTGKHAMDLMHTSKTFSREDFRLIGVDRLRLIMRYDARDQAKLLEKARKNELPRVALREYIAANPPPKGNVDIHAGKPDAEKPNVSRGEKKAVEAAAKPEARAKAETKKAAKPQPAKEHVTSKAAAAGEITAVHQLGRVKVPLMTRKDPKKRALTIGQDPFAIVFTVNGFEQTITVIKEAKGLALSIVTKKVDAKEKAA